MNREDIAELKTFVNNELQQAKPFYKRVKRLTIYKDNKPVKWNKR